MNTSNDICEKIRSVFPDVGECGIDIDVEFEKDNNAWAVHLNKGGHLLKTYLEIDDADTCIDNEKCVGLGLQIAQLRDNITRLLQQLVDNFIAIPVSDAFRIRDLYFIESPDGFIRDISVLKKNI